MAGVHGVGKGTICTELAPQFDLNHISASEILKWNEVNPDLTNKQVKDISNTQERLILGLNRFLQRDKKYILDGHFCLLNSLGQISRIDSAVFEKIAPVSIVCVTAEPEVVAKRLHARDNKDYDVNVLNAFQQEELIYGKEIAENLKVPFLQISDGDYSTFYLALSENKFFA